VELADRLPGAISQLTPEQAAGFDASDFSINEPAVIRALPEPLREAIQFAFVDALHVVFLIAGLVAIVAVAVTLALPDRELRGAAPTTDQESAADMEAQTQTMI
jgi:hypothetical protein